MSALGYALSTMSETDVGGPVRGVVLADGTDVLAEADRCWPDARAAARPFWRRFQRGRLRARPEVTIRRRRRGDHVTGRCYLDASRRVVVTLPMQAGLAEASFVLLHELAHAALPADARHGEAFRLTLAGAAAGRWPELAGVLAHPPRTARGLDRLILAELRDLTGVPSAGASPR